jgi:hypothetical protein
LREAYPFHGGPLGISTVPTFDTAAAGREFKYIIELTDLDHAISTTQPNPQARRR